MLIFLGLAYFMQEEKREWEMDLSYKMRKDSFKKFKKEKEKEMRYTNSSEH